MTIKKSKTVVFERRAGDLTALYCMNDWVIAVVLAIIAMMSVWAALIIYRYIQTERGKRRRKVDDDTILETEKDENETTNEEKILSCVESTEEGEEETLESWDGEEWRREPMEWIPTTSENVEPFDGIPTTNEDVEPIEGISATTNEDIEPVEGIPTTNEGVEPIEGIPTTNEDVEPIEGIPTTNEDVEPIEGIPTTNEGVEPIEGIPTITIDEVEPITRIRTRINEDLEPMKQIRARTNEDLQPIRRIRTLTNEDLEPIRRNRTATNEDLQPIRRIRTLTNEDLEPIRRNRTATNEDLQPIRRIRTTTNESDGPYTWESYAEWQIVEEFHLGSQPQEHCEGTCQHYDGLCQVCGGLCHCSECLCQFYEGLCQDDAESQTDRTVGQEEQASTSPYSLSDINYQSGHEKDTDVYNQDEEDLKEVELSDDCQCESTEEESEVNHSHAFAIKPQRYLEELNENLPDMILTASDLQEPDCACYTEIQEVQYTDDDMTSHVVFYNEARLEMTLTDTEHVSDKEREEVEYPDDDRHSHVAFAKVQVSENLPEMKLTETDRIEPEHVYEVEREEVEDPDEVITEGPEHPSENIPEILSDTDLQQPGNLCEEETQEVECTSDYMDSQVAFVSDTQEPEHPNEYLPDMILTDTKTKELDHVCDSEIQEVEYPGADMTSHVPSVSDRTVEDDMKEAMVEDLDMEAMVEDLCRKDCLLHDYVIDGLSQPTDVRDTHVAERKGDIVDDNSKDTRVEEEKKRQSDDTRIEESYEKVEINIMEATMDNNEWMTVSGTEDNSDSPWVRISHSSIECSSAEVEHHPTETYQNSDDATVADATAFKEVEETGTKPVSPDGDLRRNKKMAAVLPSKPKTVRVRFCVHYRTQSPWQELAVTGNQQELGSWTGFVPLERAQDGFWASWVVLPAEKQVEWKLVLVEDGEILRWEEGGNRHLETGRGGGEVYLNKCWGSL
ncbi:uncharacterized protein LOC109868728 [Oncorhynchus kisutch]|uniref:Uncharacterized LOC109868728 n=1 Tax=Oncorhynchus kisutch TaxID=8019 RepID=A0A8C7DFW3_ONCKI|nr:uncharacterized protein LOC109868728 [Oncorhynchus kisutch]